MKWSDVTRDKRYQSASPELQERIRNDFFENVIAADIPDGTDRLSIRREFDRRTDPLANDKPTFLGSLKDKAIEYGNDALDAANEFAPKLRENALRMAMPGVAAVGEGIGVAAPDGVPDEATQVYDSVKSGLKQAAAGTKVLWNTFGEDDVDDIAAGLNNYKAAIQEQVVTEKDKQFRASMQANSAQVNDAQGILPTLAELSDYARIVASNKLPAFKMGAQAMTQSIPGIAGGLLARAPGAAAGAMVGGPVGAIVGGTATGIAGGTASNYSIEAAPNVFESLVDKYGDQVWGWGDKEIAAALRESPDVIDSGLSTALKRSAAIAAVQVPVLKLAGKVATIPTSTIKGLVAKGATAGALSGASEAGGELAAQVAAGQPIDTAEAVYELTGGVAAAPVTVTMAAREFAKNARDIRQQQTPVIPANPAAPASQEVASQQVADDQLLQQLNKQYQAEAQQQQADIALQSISSAQNADEAIGLFTQATNIPITINAGPAFNAQSMGLLGLGNQYANTNGQDVAAELAGNSGIAQPDNAVGGVADISVQPDAGSNRGRTDNTPQAFAQSGGNGLLMGNGANWGSAVSAEQRNVINADAGIGFNAENTLKGEANGRQVQGQETAQEVKTFANATEGDIVESGGVKFRKVGNGFERVNETLAPESLVSTEQGKGSAPVLSSSGDGIVKQATPSNASTQSASQAAIQQGESIRRKLGHKANIDRLDRATQSIRDFIENNPEHAASIRENIDKIIAHVVGGSADAARNGQDRKDLDIVFNDGYDSNNRISPEFSSALSALQNHINTSSHAQGHNDMQAMIDPSGVDSSKPSVDITSLVRDAIALQQDQSSDLNATTTPQAAQNKASEPVGSVQSDGESRNEAIRPIVEAIAKRRAVAEGQLGKAKAYGRVLEAGKRLLNGESVNVGDLKIAANELKADKELHAQAMKLVEIASQSAKQARKEAKGAVKSYRERIAKAKSSEELRAIANEVRHDTVLSDAQAQQLDGEALKAEDALTKTADQQGVDKERLANHKETLRAWLPDFDWAERGGRIIRNEKGAVSGRTPWVPKVQEFRDILDGVKSDYPQASFAKMRQAVNKALIGGKLNGMDARFVNALLDFAESVSFEDVPAEVADAANSVMADVSQSDDWLDAFGSVTNEAEFERAMGYGTEQGNESETGQAATAETQAGDATGVQEAQGEGKAGQGNGRNEVNLLSTYTNQEVLDREQQTAARESAANEAERKAEDARREAQVDKERQSRAGIAADAFTLTPTASTAADTKKADEKTANDQFAGQGGLFAANPAGNGPGNEITHNGVRIYKTRISQRGEMWAVETADNKAKREAGERTIGGDTLHGTLDEAKRAADAMVEAEKRDAESQRAEEARNAERKAQEEARKADDYNGFLSDKSDLQKGLIRKTLDKQVRINGNATTIRDYVEQNAKAGTLEASTMEEPKIKPMSRTQFNRADNRQQAEHERKMKEAGNKTTYLVNGYELGRFAHDYAKHLLANKPGNETDFVTKTGDAAQAAKPTPQYKAGDRVIPSKDVFEGDIVRTDDGKLWMAKVKRGHNIPVFPFENGKPSVSADTRRLIDLDVTEVTHTGTNYYGYGEQPKPTAQPSEQVKAEPAEAKEAEGSGQQGSGNTFITDEKYEEAKAKLAENLAPHKLNSNPFLDPENARLVAIIGAYHIEHGARTLAKFTKAMKQEAWANWELLKERIESIFAQSMRDWELSHAKLEPRVQSTKSITHSKEFLESRLNDWLDLDGEIDGRKVDFWKDIAPLIAEAAEEIGINKVYIDAANQRIVVQMPQWLLDRNLNDPAQVLWNTPGGFEQRIYGKLEGKKWVRESWSRDPLEAGHYERDSRLPMIEWNGYPPEFHSNNTVNLQQGVKPWWSVYDIKGKIVNPAESVPIKPATYITGGYAFTAQSRGKKARLFVLRNMELGDLNALKSGVMNNPSIALTDKPITGFGEITFVGDRGIVQPKEKGHYLFSGDAWTVMSRANAADIIQPEPQNIGNQGEVLNLLDSVREDGQDLIKNTDNLGKYWFRTQPHYFGSTAISSYLTKEQNEAAESYNNELSRGDDADKSELKKLKKAANDIGVNVDNLESRMLEHKIIGDVSINDFPYALVPKQIATHAERMLRDAGYAGSVVSYDAAKDNRLDILQELDATGRINGAGATDSENKKAKVAEIKAELDRLSSKKMTAAERNRYYDLLDENARLQKGTAQFSRSYAGEDDIDDSDTRIVSRNMSEKSAAITRAAHKVASQKNPADKARVRGYYDRMLGLPSRESEYSKISIISYQQGVKRADNQRALLKGKTWFESDIEKDGSKWKWAVYAEGMYVASGTAASETKAYDATIDARVNYAALYSRSVGVHGNGIAMRDAEAVIDRLSRGYNNLPPILLFAKPSQLKGTHDELLADINKARATADVEAAFHEGKIYVFIDNLSSTDRLEHVLFNHEVGHYGLRGVFGQDLDPMLDYVLKHSIKLQLETTRKQRTLGIKSRIEALEEVIVDMKPEELVKLKGWNKVAMFIRNWLESHGFTNLANRVNDYLTSKVGEDQAIDMMVADMITKARNWAKNGKRSGSTDIYLGVTRLSDVRESWYYSQLEKGIEGAKQESMPAAQWKLWLASNAGKMGIKQDEIQWTGINEYLDLQGKGKVSKADILNYLAQNGVQVQETMLGNIDESDVELWWNDEGGANEETPYSELSDAERKDAIQRYREEVAQYADGATKYATYKVPGGPLSRDTEILTRDGWVRIDSVHIGAEVMTRKDDSGELEWNEVEAKPEVFAEKLYHFKNQSINMRVTDGHKMVVKRRRRSTGEIFRTTAKDLWGMSECVVPLTGTWVGSAKSDLYGLPAGDVAELIGWYISEGSATRGWNREKSTIGIAQSRTANPEKCERLESLFDRLGFKWSHTKSGATETYYLSIRSMPSDLVELLHAQGNASDKYIPGFMFDLSKEVIGRLLIGLLLGDGCLVRQNGRKPRWTYHTKSKQLADDVQVLSLLIGMRGTITQRKNGLYTVYINSKEWASVDDAKFGIVDYNDTAYCVTVKNHSIYVRTNGIAAFTGNSNYRELLLTLPTQDERVANAIGRARMTGEEMDSYLRLESLSRRGEASDAELAELARLEARKEESQRAYAKARKLDGRKDYISTHFDQPNILAHVRFDERTDADGKRVLFLHEIQSDFAQTKRQGEHEIAAPFIDDTKAWVSLALKRMIAYAASNGFDKVAIISGQQAADLYDLSKHIDRVAITKTGGVWAVNAWKNGNKAITKDAPTDDDLANIVGKELAEKAIKDGGGDYSGLDLKVGGEGMHAFYDNIVPQIANDVLKKVGGGKVESIVMEKGGMRPHPDGMDVEVAAEIQTGFTITPAMREKVASGLPLFSKKEGKFNDAFWKWFGDSKVVDADGKPLVVYHGTASDITAFDMNMSGESTGNTGFYGAGAYFSEDADYASGFSFWAKRSEDHAPNVVPVYLSLKNPAYINITPKQQASIEKSKATAAKLISTLIDRGTGQAVVEKLRGFVSENKFEPFMGTLYNALGGGTGTTALLKEAGFDGVTIYGGISGKEKLAEAVAFDPTQIKSAIGNNGQWDANNPDIRYSRKPSENDSVVPAETKAQAAQRVVQDQFNRFKVLNEWLNKQGFDFSDSEDVYLNETQYHGRVAARKEDFRETVMKPLIEKTQKAGFTIEQVADFLMAQHAPEANKRQRDIHQDDEATAYGITDDEARQAMDEFKKLDNFAELKAIASEWRGITEQTKKILLDSGLRSKEEVAAWEAAYDFYIPVKGDEQKTGTGKGLHVNAKHYRRLGHEKRDEAVIENILSDHERAIALDEKNRVGKALIRWAVKINNPDIITVGKPEKRQVLRNGESRYVVQYKGKDVVVAETEAEARYYITAETAAGKTRSDFVIEKTTDPARVILQASPMLADNEVTVYVGGNAVRVQINDEIAARAYKRLGVEHLNSLLGAGRIVNNWLSKVYTGYSPDFIFTNMLRDATQGLMTLTGEYGITTAAKVFANYRFAVNELIRHFRHHGSSDLVADYRAHGGAVGAAYLSDLERIGNDVMSAYDEYAGVMNTYKRVYDGEIESGSSAARAQTKAMLKSGLAGAKRIPAVGHLLRFIERINAMTENALRVATYKTLVDSGVSKNRAAAQAKNLMNFNRKGEISNQAGALYLFFNPGVQGSQVMYRALFDSKHKKQVQSLVGMMVLNAIAISMLNASGDDDDKKRWDETKDSVKDGNLVFTIGGTNVTITLPYGYRLFHMLGNVIYDYMDGKNPDKLGIRLANGVFENLSPLGNPMNGGVFQMFPTAAKMAAGPGVNQDSRGNKIGPKRWNDYIPDSQLMNRSTRGSFYDSAADFLNDASGGNDYQKGYVDVSPETLKFWVRSLTGGAGQAAFDAVGFAKNLYDGVDTKTKNMPIIRRFVADDPMDGKRDAFYEAMNDVKQSAAEFNAAKKAHDTVAMREMLAEDGPLIRLSHLANNMKKMADAKRDAIVDVKSNDKLTPSEKMLKIEQYEKSEAKAYDVFLNEFERASKRAANQ